MIIQPSILHSSNMKNIALAMGEIQPVTFEIFEKIELLKIIPPHYEIFKSEIFPIAEKQKLISIAQMLELKLKGKFAFSDLQETFSKLSQIDLGSLHPEDQDAVKHLLILIHALLEEGYDHRSIQEYLYLAELR